MESCGTACAPCPETPRPVSDRLDEVYGMLGVAEGILASLIGPAQPKEPTEAASPCGVVALTAGLQQRVHILVDRLEYLRSLVGTF